MTLYTHVQLVSSSCYPLLMNSSHWDYETEPKMSLHKTKCELHIPNKRIIMLIRWPSSIIKWLLIIAFSGHVIYHFEWLWFIFFSIIIMRVLGVQYGAERDGWINFKLSNMFLIYASQWFCATQKLKLKLHFFNNSIIIFLPLKGEIFMQLSHESPKKLPIEVYPNADQDRVKKSRKSYLWFLFVCF